MRRFPASIISGTQVVPAPTSASGIWTLPEQLQSVKAGTWQAVFSGPVAITSTAFDSSGTDTTSYTFTSKSIGTASLDRVVIVGVWLGDNVVTSVSSLTVGGISATKVAEQTSTDAHQRSEIWAASVTTGTTATIVVNTAATTLSCGISVYAMTGTGGRTTAASNGGSAADPGSATITIPAGGGAVAMAGNFATRTHTWTNITEDVESSVVGEINFSSAHRVDSTLQSGLSVSVAYSATTSNTGSMAVAVWASV